MSLNRKMETTTSTSSGGCCYRSPLPKRSRFEYPKISSHLSNRRPLSEITPDTANRRRIATKRKPAEISPSALSRPIRIPQILINSPTINTDDGDDSFDEVFDKSIKENLNPIVGKLQRTEILFPSFGTSPSKAYLIDSPTNQSSNRFSKDLLDDPTIKKLGKGSYGTVILGFWRGERVAMKKLSRRDSLENEMHAMNLNHENVTKIREVFDDIKEDQNSAILVLEYVGQNSLQILIEQQPSKLTPKLTKSFLIQVAKGLKHCHDNLIVHLDIKPANVLVTSRGVCKLADFGCSHRLENNQELKPVDVFTPGTPGYQAPEMFKLKILHRKCDIFSFGILMWQLLVKEPNPYPETHPHTIIFLVVSEDSRPIKEPSRSWAMYEPLYKLCWDKDFQIRPNIQYVLKQLGSHARNQSGSPLNLSRKSSGAGMLRL